MFFKASVAQAAVTNIKSLLILDFSGDLLTMNKLNLLLPPGFTGICVYSTVAAEMTCVIRC